jgi:hypothetical protein
MTFTDPNDSMDQSPANAGEPAPKPRWIPKKKGGNKLKYDLIDLLESIERRGEAVPGDLAKEFGWARSSLTYALKLLLKRKKIVKIGGGRSTRYRVATKDDFAPKISNIGQNSNPTQTSIATPEQEPLPSKENWSTMLKILLGKLVNGR